MPVEFDSIKTLIRFMVVDPSPGLFTSSYLKSKKIFSNHQIEDDLSFPFPPTSNYLFTDNHSFGAYQDNIELRVNSLNRGQITPEIVDDLDQAARVLMKDISYMKFSSFQIGFDLFYTGIKSLRPLIQRLSPAQELNGLFITEAVGDFFASHSLAILIARPDEDVGDPHTALEVSSNFAAPIPSSLNEDESVDLIERLLEQRPHLFEKTKEVVNALHLSE